MTVTFTSIAQARVELPRDRGWIVALLWCCVRLRGRAHVLTTGPKRDKKATRRRVRIMTGHEPPADSNVVTRTGPWTVLSCITAACTRCGAVPLDEDTGITPHFASVDQAREELPLNWGWIVAPRSIWPKDDKLLCPDCAKAGDGSLPPSPRRLL